MHHLNFTDPENNVRAKITFDSVICPRFGTENTQAHGYILGSQFTKPTPTLSNTFLKFIVLWLFLLKIDFSLEKF